VSVALPCGPALFPDRRKRSGTPRILLSSCQRHKTSSVLAISTMVGLLGVRHFVPNQLRQLPATPIRVPHSLLSTPLPMAETAWLRHKKKSEITNTTIRCTVWPARDVEMNRMTLPRLRLIFTIRITEAVLH
jgi:hypothetical protein